MAKKKRKHNFSQVQIERFGTDIESLSLHSTEVGVEIRVDPRDPDVKRRVEMLSRYGLVKYRIHANGDKIWRVALTELGAEIAVAHEKRIARRKVTQESVAERDEMGVDEQIERLVNGEDDKGGIEQIELPPDPVLITTQTLRAFQQKAIEKDFSRVLTDEVMDSLLPNAKHKVVAAWKHTSFEGYKNMRLQVEIYTKPSVLDAKPSDFDTRRIICDITTRDWDMLMVPHQYKTRRNSIVPGNTNVMYLQAPEWAAVRSYPVVHELHSFYHGVGAAHIVSGWPGERGSLSIPQGFGRWRQGGEPAILRGEAAQNFITHPRMVMNSAFCEALQDAHPVIIDPEWVEIQEDWNFNEAWAYAERVVLPFDPLYLDFQGPGGQLPLVNVYENVSVELVGCLFYHDWVTGRLIISPVGGSQWLDPTLGTHRPAGGFPYEQIGEIAMGGRCDSGRPFQVTLDGQDPITVEGAYVVPTNMQTVVTEAIAMDLPSYQEQREASGDEVPEIIEEPWKIPGYIQLPLLPEQGILTIEGDPIANDNAWMGIWGKVVTKLAAKSLSILSLLDNENVEIREAELPRQQRRQIERERSKGREKGIASEIVVVRKTRYVNGTKVDSDHQIEYSHQWRVRRHEQHHGPHTRTYQSKPWKAKPCGRCGSCRRFIIESYIKGPVDKPLKDNKTYKFQDPED
jgi:hypothetical protein